MSGSQPGSPATAPPTLAELERQLDGCLRVDRFRFRRQIRQLQGERPARKNKSGSTGGTDGEGKPDNGQTAARQQSERQRARLAEQIASSRKLCEQRRNRKLKLQWDEELPITSRREEIAAAIQANPVVVICGETGSGKSTQLPKICLELGRGVEGTIGHTQPRRIAARSVAARVAEEVGSAVGDAVGFRVRFADATSPLTRVKVMTDGILLAETQGDRFLEQYDTLIIDEAHERSLNIDFLLGILRRLLEKRSDLKVIITSATLDAEKFSRHFTIEGRPAPVIEVSGRTWPVEVRYRPLEDRETPGGTPAEPDLQESIFSAVCELAGENNGDMLVFLPTERDIRETATSLRGRRIPGDYAGRETEILPLYGRLSVREQSRVFQPHPHRRIVLATNVAESSLTVPGIFSVIDPGTARISRWSSRSGVQRLPIEPVSQASANQRAGRCGRIGPGVCIRLYSQQDFNSREAFTSPEHQRTNLASVILRTIHLKLGHIDDFPFLDPPRTSTVREGYKTLEELGAIDAEGNLTEIGRRMARMPVDPRISRIILASIEEHAAPEVMAIAAALEIQDPRERPIEKQQAADEAHAQFKHRDSDFLTLLNLWDAWHERSLKLSNSQLRKWCQQNFLSWLRMREWVDVHRQLKDLLSESDDESLRRAAHLHPFNDRKNDLPSIHRSLMTGLLANIAFQTPE
ncbi:MAG: ATP-dependent RNA helicase HrpA, partial [Planctomycetaceae bacterium]|nr:ATP-dependent RNA helicase HrpA [Planctomycetaceae bacterium]